MLGNVILTVHIFLQNIKSWWKGGIIVKKKTAEALYVHICCDGATPVWRLLRAKSATSMPLPHIRHSPFFPLPSLGGIYDYALSFGSKKNICAFSFVCGMSRIHLSLSIATEKPLFPIGQTFIYCGGHQALMGEWEIATKCTKINKEIIIFRVVMELRCETVNARHFLFLSDAKRNEWEPLSKHPAL